MAVGDPVNVNNPMGLSYSGKSSTVKESLSRAKAESAAHTLAKGSEPAGKIKKGGITKQASVKATQAQPKKTTSGDLNMTRWTQGKKDKTPSKMQKQKGGHASPVRGRSDR